MKKHIVYLLAICTLFACDYEKVNTNLYGITDEDTKMGGLAYGGPLMNMQQLVVPIGSPSSTTGPGNDLQNTDLISSGNYIGYFGNNNNWNFNTEANWNFVDSRMSYAMKNFYSKLFLSWNEINKQVNKSEDPYDQQVLAIANIIKITGWLRATDVFGPLVYTKAGDGDIAPKLDSQEIVYKAMLKDLAEAVKVLQKGSGNILTEYDLIYNGDTKKWVKLANSLMLRMGVRVHFKDEALAREYIALALDPASGGVIEKRDEEAKIQYSDKMPLLNSMLASVDEYGETRMGATIWSYLDGYGDPRIQSYFRKGVYLDEEGYYPVAPTNEMSKGTGPNTAYFAAKPKVEAHSPLFWLRASEVSFLRAEAALYGLGGGDAKTYYEEGVRFSFEENGVSGADAYLQKTSLPSDLTRSDYKYGYRRYSCNLSVQNTSPRWDDFNPGSLASRTEQQLQKIITQKYLALYPNAVEAWTEYRRTGYPFLMKPFDKDAAGRIGAAADVVTPERFRFAPSEYSTNPNMSLIPGLLGGEDNGATRLWWVRNDRPKQP